MRALRREAPLLALLLYGGAFAYAAFGRGVPAFDLQSNSPSSTISITRSMKPSAAAVSVR